MRKLIFLLALLSGASVAMAAFAADQAPPPGVFPHGEKDLTLAPAGTYTLDPNHTGVIARVSHLGFSRSVFRFERVTGTLNWDPKNVARSTLSATVDTASIATPVVNFAAQLAGPKYLNAVTFPQATFVSTAFRRTDATHGKVDGTFTLLGKSKPVTFDVSLIGAGAFFGRTIIGIHAETAISAQDFGMAWTLADPIEIAIDSELSKPQ